LGLFIKKFLFLDYFHIENLTFKKMTYEVDDLTPEWLREEVKTGVSIKIYEIFRVNLSNLV
jgi:hypothetical protein